MNIGGFGLMSWRITMKEMKTTRFYKDVVCEGFLTFLFMTFVTQSSMAFPSANNYVSSLVGFCVIALVESYGHLNPALFNPNLVVALVFSRRMSIPKGILFSAIEIGAGVAATKMVYEMTPEDIRRQLGPPGPTMGIPDGYAWVCEFIAVLFFASTLLGAVDGKRKNVQIPHLAIGLCVSAAATIGAPYGVALNPIVSFSFSFVADSWGRSWIYWTAGPVAGLVACVFYYFFAYDEGSCAKTDPEEEEDDTSVELAKGVANGGYEIDEKISTITTERMTSQVSLM